MVFGNGVFHRFDVRLWDSQETTSIEDVVTDNISTSWNAPLMCVLTHYPALSISYLCCAGRSNFISTWLNNWRKLICYQSVERHLNSWYLVKDLFRHAHHWMRITGAARVSFSDPYINCGKGQKGSSVFSLFGFRKHQFSMLVLQLCWLKAV